MQTPAKDQGVEIFLKQIKVSCGGGCTRQHDSVGRVGADAIRHGSQAYC